MAIFDDILTRLQPPAILDIGCGCGAATQRLRRFAPRIAAVDVMTSLIPRWSPLRDPPGRCGVVARKFEEAPAETK